MVLHHNRRKRVLEVWQHVKIWEKQQKKVSLELQLHQSTRYPLKGVALKNSSGVLSGLLQLASYSFLVLEHLSKTEELAKVSDSIAGGGGGGLDDIYT